MLGANFYRNNGLSAFGDLGAMSCAQRNNLMRRGTCPTRRARWDDAVAAGCVPSIPRPSCSGSGMAGSGFSGVLSGIADAAKSAVSSVPTPLLLAGAAGAAYLLLRKKR